MMDLPRPRNELATRFSSYTTRCFAKVYRFDGPPLDLIGHVEHGHNNGKPTIVNASTMKSIAAPSGTFTLTVRLNPHSFDIHEEIKNGDWISIWWQRGDRKLHGMLGNIDGVRRLRTVAGEGATSEEYVITGRDVGKVFETAEVWFNEYVKFGSNVGGRIIADRFNYVPGGTPDRVVENILDAFLGAAGNVGGAWVWPQGLEHFGTYFAQGLRMFVGGSRGGKYRRAIYTPKVEVTAADLDAIAAAEDFGTVGTRPSSPLCRGELIDEVSLFQPEPGTKIHDMMTRWSNPLLNELFYDIDVRTPFEAPRPLVVLRERPFVSTLFDLGETSPWFSLPTVYVSRDEMYADDLGSNDQERINLIMLYARSSTMTQMDQYAAYPPTIDLDDARKHGLRRWERQIDFAGVGSTGDGGSWGEEIATWEDLLKDWYGLNHAWLNGSATFKFLLAEARIGHRLVIEGNGEDDMTQAYIESVQTSWSFPSGAQTVLSLSRGFIGTDQQLLEAVRQRAARWKRPGLIGDFPIGKTGTGVA